MESPRQLILKIALGDQITTHEVAAPTTVVIGRGAEASIRIDHASISRRHAAFLISDTIAIVDLGSKNGTLLRGERISSVRISPVEHGDSILIGDAVVLVLPGGERPSVASNATDISSRDKYRERMANLMSRIAPSELSVLVRGETGAGKQVVAEAIHAHSQRAGRLLVRVNCASLTASLLERELEASRGGTMFLDEIGDLTSAAQAALHHVLEAAERSDHERPPVRRPRFDIRIVASTNRDLEAEIAAGRFRLDLYFRLNSATVYVPPLRERRDEIVELARAFAAPVALSHDAVDELLTRPWLGNVRELRHTIERAVLLCDGNTIGRAHLVESDDGQPAVATMPAPELDARPGERRVTREQLLEALEQCAGNQTRAARMLGVSRKTLMLRLDEFGVARPRKPR